MKETISEGNHTAYERKSTFIRLGGLLILLGLTIHMVCLGWRLHAFRKTF